MKVLNDQPWQPRDSQSLQSYSKGLNEIRVLWDEQPPSTFALECRMCEFPGQGKQRQERSDITTTRYQVLCQQSRCSGLTWRDDALGREGKEVLPIGCSVVP